MSTLGISKDFDGDDYMPVEATLVKNPISRPGEPRHFMVIKQLQYPVEAHFRNSQVASSKQALKLLEAGNDLYDPVIYFPPEHVEMQLLRKSAKTTECPLKGTTEYFDIHIEGQIIENVAWSYNHVYDFDERLQQIRTYIAFDSRYVQLIELTAG